VAPLTVKSLQGSAANSSETWGRHPVQAQIFVAAK
jgi:hypothetical protein